jgi:hypothetical protein
VHIVAIETYIEEMQGGRNQRTKARRTRVLLVACAIAGTMTAALGSVTAAAASDVCPSNDSGKIDTTGDPQSVVHTAPSGLQITGYCVQAGSHDQGDGPERVTLTTPVATLTIAHSSGEAVSHYSFSYATPVTKTATAPSTDCGIICGPARVTATSPQPATTVAPDTTAAATTPTTVCGIICGPARVTATSPQPTDRSAPATAATTVSTATECGAICGPAAIATTPPPTTQPLQEELRTVATDPSVTTDPPTAILATGGSTPDPTTTQPTQSAAAIPDDSPTPPSSGTLPETGGSSLPIVALALWSLLAGLVMHLTATRRRRTA